MSRNAAVPTTAAAGADRDDDPLDGFMGHDDWRGSCLDMKLANGVFWPIPITLPVDKDLADGVHAEEEVAHGISVQAAAAFADWHGVKINLLDTPGYLDFTGDAIAATRVADGAVVVLGATTGVEVGTEKVWEYCLARGIPRFFFVSMMDKENADFDRVCGEIRHHMTPRAVAVEGPSGAGESFRGIVNLFTGRAHIFRSATVTGEYDEADVPAELAAEVGGELLVPASTPPLVGSREGSDGPPRVWPGSGRRGGASRRFLSARARPSLRSPALRRRPPRGRGSLDKSRDLPSPLPESVPCSASNATA